MSISYTVHGIRTPLIRPGDDIALVFLSSLPGSMCGGLQDRDIIIAAESAVATAEGRIVELSSVVPSREASLLGEQYNVDPRMADLVIRESDAIAGGISGFILSLTAGTLLPNAGIDASNAPPGCVVLLPKDPDKSASEIRSRLQHATGHTLAVIIADSRTHAMRMGSGGVAIGCAGIQSVIDDRGRLDLFGRELHVTRRAIADNLASAAEVVMGEADESVPFAVIRGLGILHCDQVGIETISAEECLFMGLLGFKGA